jgi:hypothetical protein
LRPGADISKIKISYTGIEALKINEDRGLTIKTAWKNFDENAPYSYQKIQGLETQIKVNYTIINANTLGFEAIDEIDRTKTLTIDPVLLEWSTYFYGDTRFKIDNFNQIIQNIGGVDIDSKGFVYVAGTTNQDFPQIPGLHNSKPKNTPIAYTDAYYCKISPAGDSFVFFNYIGSPYNDGVYSMRINSKNEAAIIGFGGTGFPFTKGALDSTKGFFITTFNSRGDSIKFSTFYPNGAIYSNSSPIITESGDVIISGMNNSGTLPVTSGAYQSKHQGGLYDGYVAKIKSDGKKLLFATYIGGSSAEYFYGVTINANEDIYLTGCTFSNDFPTVTNNPNFKAPKGGADAFLLKLDKSGSKLLFSNIIGGNGEDILQSVCLNATEDIFVSGYTNSTNYPLSIYPKPYQTANAGKRDLVVMKFFPNGGNYRYSTYLGGSNEDYADNWINNIITQIAVNIKDEAIIMGVSQSKDFPITNDAIQKDNKAMAKKDDPVNLTLSKLSITGDKLLYSTFFGGGYADFLLAGRIKRFNCVTNIVIGGATMSRDFPTTKVSLFPKAPSDTLFGDGKYHPYYFVGFIAKFSDTLHVDKPDFGFKEKTRCNDFLEILDGLNQGSYRRWSTGDSSRFLMVSKPGTYWIKASYGCDTVRDSITIYNQMTKADFTVSDSGLCFKNNVFDFKETTKFTNNKKSKSIWYFNDSNSIADSIVHKVFKNPGTYNVKLVSIGNDGCSDSAIKVINVYPGTKVDFMVNDSLQCFNNHSFDFVILKDTGNVSYEWDLGDQNLNTGKDVYGKKYLKDSIYQIKLFASTIKNCKDTAVKYINFLQNPHADFTWDITCQRSITNFKFTGKKLSSPIITNFKWNFNNEDTSTLNNPHHQFVKTGNAKVTLILSSNNGCYDTMQKVLEIKPHSKADFIVNDVCENDSAVFNNKSQDATGYNWKFGDGQSSQIQHPKHKFEISNTTTFNVSLLATVNNGCFDSITKAITVNQNPNSNFNYTIAGTKIDLKAIINGLSKYKWTFNNTDSFTTNNQTFSQILKSGQNQVCLVVTDLVGCSSKTCKDIAVGSTNHIKHGNFVIYPNPNNGNFIIKIDNPTNEVSIAIFDLIGNLIKTIEATSSEQLYHIELPKTQGIYIVKVTNAGNVWNQRVMVSCIESNR